MARWSCALLCLLLAPASPARAEEVRPALAGAVILPNGLALPYPTLRVFRAFGRCKRAGKRPERWQGPWRSHEHEGIDLGGVGPHGGLGTAVRSLTRAKVTAIVHGDDRPAQYGVIDRRDGEAWRDGERYPRALSLAGYGTVHFFTRARGWYRTGNMVVTEGLEGPLAGHRIRYMHLGAARPDLVVGDVLEAGEELGVLGGTAVQDAAPHVHIDVRDREGEAVDVAPLIGLRTSAWCGVPRERALADRRAFKAAAGKRRWRPDTWAPAAGAVGVAVDAPRLAPIDLLRTPAPLVAAGLVDARARFWHDVIVAAPCTARVVEEDFASGAYAGHAWKLRVLRGQVYDLDVRSEEAARAPRYALVEQGGARVLHVGGAPVPAPAPPASDDDEAEAITVSTPFDDASKVRIEARETSEVLITVLAQAEPYRVTVQERCRIAR